MLFFIREKLQQVVALYLVLKMELQQIQKSVELCGIENNKRLDVTNHLLESKLGAGTCKDTEN